MSEAQASGIVEHASPFPFEETLERLAQAMTAAGMTIFARVDHAANARSAGLAMPPATVLTYGAAKGGTPIMLAAPLSALDLPLRVLVRRDGDGKVSIAFHPVADMLRRDGVDEAAAQRLAPAQQLLIEAITP